MNRLRWGIGGLRWRRLKWRLGGGGVVILLYHRVAEVSCDPSGNCVSPRHFAEQMAALRTIATPLPLRQLAGALAAGNLPRRAVVVTFDDGYADNLYHAKPVLERYNVPATVFLATGYVLRRREFWWDALARLLLQPSERLPEMLRLTLNGSVFEWRLGEVAHREVVANRRSRYWKLADEPPTGRHALYRELWQRLRILPPAQQEAAMEELLAWSGVASTCDPAQRPLSVQEVTSLVQGGLIEVGAHTVTHPMLSAHPAALQRAEIRQSKAECEEIAGCPVASFSYPYGAYTEESVAAVAEAGFSCACMAAYGLVRRGSDRLRLPRVYVRDWDGERFARWLSRGV